MNLILTVVLAVATVTSLSSYYDRKEGYACLNGDVSVSDAEYRLHADRAFVFMDVSNQMSRIVAYGRVAVTNGTKRAYGDKVAYFRDPGMIVLYADEGKTAEVRDEGAKGNQVVRGRKIRFWTASEQVEVVEADLTAPNDGKMDDFNKTLGN